MKKKTLVLVVVFLLIVSVFSLSACKKSEDTSLLFGKELLKVTSQMDILTNLKNGSADIGVMDSVMANYYMSVGSEYANDLQIVPNSVFVNEQYGIGAKKGNAALMSKINEGIIANAANGSLLTIAQKYNLENVANLVTKDTVNPKAGATDGSFDKVKAAKKLIVGYTVFAPISYKEGGVETGFDIDLARKVVEYLNATYQAEIAIEFTVIEWTSKETLLDNGSIDLVWNGMTITQERTQNMEISIPYMTNSQVAVIRKADAAKYGTLGKFVSNMRNAIVAVESGSAANSIVEIIG